MWRGKISRMSCKGIEATLGLAAEYGYLRVGRSNLPTTFFFSSSRGYTLVVSLFLNQNCKLTVILEVSTDIRVS
jgi:hypothetical protein